MNKKVGIPRAMFYYDYDLLWERFFNNLGSKVIVSPKTNKDILNRGINTCVDEACLPVKVFHGHVDYLKDKVDYIFVPKFISIYKKEYCCPKHLGLPDMIKHSIDGLPNIIDTKIDLRKSNRSLKDSIIYTGRYFTKNSKKILDAYQDAHREFKKQKEFIVNQTTEKKDDKSQVLLLGHSYNIYDEYINMNIFNKLENNGVKPITVEMLEEDKIRDHTSKLAKRMFWTQGQKIVGAAFELMDKKTIDGIIYISSFGCGLDSVLMELVARKAKDYNMPFTLLTIDEQTGEAGINTRVEAFLDMLEWREKNEYNFSTHG